MYTTIRFSGERAFDTMINELYVFGTYNTDDKQFEKALEDALKHPTPGVRVSITRSYRFKDLVYEYEVGDVHKPSVYRYFTDNQRGYLEYRREEKNMCEFPSSLKVDEPCCTSRLSIPQENNDFLVFAEDFRMGQRRRRVYLESST
jgi:hypothetical protein